MGSPDSWCELCIIQQWKNVWEKEVWYLISVSCWYPNFQDKDVHIQVINVSVNLKFCFHLLLSLCTLSQLIFVNTMASSPISKKTRGYGRFTVFKKKIYLSFLHSLTFNIRILCKQPKACLLVQAVLSCSVIAFCKLSYKRAKTAQISCMQDMFNHKRQQPEWYHNTV